MEELISKIQLNTFEPGEFIDEKPRTLHEVLAVIDAIPWQQQRGASPIDVTTTSVTIEAGAQNYLKLALYYNDKFVLYFFNGKELFSKGITTTAEATPTITGFFDTGSVDLSLFKKEALLFKQVTQHFVSKDFIYTATKDRVTDFILDKSGINLLLSLVILICFVAVLRGTAPVIVGIGIIFPVWFFTAGGGIHLLATLNYFWFMKGKKLVISKGNGVFWFGDEGDLKQYSKKDIQTVIIKTPKYSRSLLYGFAVFKIHFSNNTYPIAFNSLLIDMIDLKAKFESGLQEYENSYFPFMQPIDN